MIKVILVFKVKSKLLDSLFNKLFIKILNINNKIENKFSENFVIKLKHSSKKFKTYKKNHYSRIINTYKNKK